MAEAQIRPDWTVGTLTLTSGSKDFTTTGSALQAAAIQAGDEIITASGLVLIVASITGQNAGTLMEDCPASAAGEDQPLRVRFQPDGSRYNGAVADMVQLLGSGNVYSLAELVLSAGQFLRASGPGVLEAIDGDNLSALAALTLANNKLPYATGPHTMELTDLTAFARGLLAAADTDAAYGALGTVPVAQIPGTLTPDKAFRRGNILGTVSQSGGIPTGAIVQRGSNANGEFVRFADGTQICWVETTMSSTNSQGGVFITTSAEEQLWTFPSSFSTFPSLDGVTTSGAYGAVGVGRTVRNGNVYLGLMSAISRVGTGMVYSATGRWF